jgi:peptide/nickel transport system substrate-binding protein
VEAEDIHTTFVRALDPATSNPNRGQLSMIDPNGIQTPDKQTVIFKLNFPYAPFNRTLVSPAYSWILPREVSTGAVDPAKQVIGSGPFLLDTATPDVAYTYKRNPNWFDKPRPYVDAIKVAVVPDSSQQQAQFTAGNLDEISVPDPATVDAMTRSNPKAALVKAVNGTPNPVFWQLGDPNSAFQDIRVRRAFNMAVDRDTLAKVIFEGQAVAPVFIPPSMGKWSMLISNLPAGTQQYFKYNPAEAKKLLDAAGAGSLQLQLAYPNTFGTPTYVKHCETIGNMLNAVGVKTAIVVIDYNKDYIDSGKGISQGYYDKSMIVFGGFSPYTEADEWLFSYYHSKSLNSHQHLNDPKMDAMIDKERTLLDENQRLKAVLDIQRYIADQALFMPTVGPYYYFLVQPRVKSYQFSDTLAVHTETYSKLWLNA